MNSIRKFVEQDQQRQKRESPKDRVELPTFRSLILVVLLAGVVWCLAWISVDMLLAWATGRAVPI